MDLFSSYRLGKLDLPNRIVMAPMTRCRALGGVPNELMATYYAQRAAAGLIVTEGVAPAPSGQGYARIPGLYSEAQVAGWRKVTERVHAAGGRIFAQLMHTGRISHPQNLPAGARHVAPSAVASAGTMWTDQAGLQPFPAPEEMSLADVEEARDSFVSAAKNAIAAGFDGVELHGANGYLIEQFLNPHSNRREDVYGGSLDKRQRFVVEVVEKTAAAIGADRLGVRLSPFNTFNDLPVYDEASATYAALAPKLRGLGYVHLLINAHPAFEATAQAIRAGFGGTMMLNLNLTRASAEERLARGEAELFSFGRPFVSNPDLVQRLKTGAPLAEANAQTFYTPGPEGYTDYPSLA